ncbi:PREDICTED: uncharacterized protein LOC108358298 isoform X2 [Rhagoletis zephyria]|uniref:uncharacterized protein LOC108358298 isoform X2 n=1 Tax=Rhagoletis zephyria TaxID=28612 RepID=UPI00081154FF|nr:PREDICTED: uncharacterized protein LOC108358298 isoform X2 [Rhagoletis zephyria]
MNSCLDNIEVCINEVPKIRRCCICGERTSTQSTIENTSVGSPPILLKDVIFKCIEPPEYFWKMIADETANNYICAFCEVSLSEFYDAFLQVSLKRTEFLRRFRERSESPVEYFVVFKSSKMDSNSYRKSIDHQSAENTEMCHPIENHLNVYLGDEYKTQNLSNDEFVEVYQPEERLEDDWSSDCSNGLQARLLIFYTYVHGTASDYF